jgi:hypothetical protein
MNTTEELAHRKRRIERLLRGIGFSRAEAKRAAARLVAEYVTKIFAVASLPCGDAGREVPKQYAEQSQLPAPTRVMRHGMGQDDSVGRRKAQPNATGVMLMRGDEPGPVARCPARIAGPSLSIAIRAPATTGAH